MITTLKFTEYSQRSNLLKQKVKKAFSDAGKELVFRKKNSESIKLVFAGQYSAGKSSILKGSLRNVGVVKSICKQKQTAAYQSSNHGISATGGFTSHGYSCRNRVSFVN